MANIRIKDLSTTASTTASDDFFGVDGATNGTRKLNAYSPTFGGNLTVSGNVYGSPNLVLNGTTGATGNVYLRAQGIGYVRVDTGSGFRVESGSLDVTNGNLTVSGGTITGGTSGLSLASGGTNQNITLTPSGTGKMLLKLGDVDSQVNVEKRGTADIAFLGGNAAGSAARTLYFQGASVQFGIGGVGEVGRFAPSTGNFLLGTTTDSGNGKLQLATHTTSAGGIGFGTADSFYTAGVGDFRLKTTSAEAAITLLSGGAYIGSVTAGKSTFIVSGGGTTALTLDASQNATFAGTVTASKAGTAFYSIESTVNGAISEVIVKGKNSTGTAREARLGLNKYADDVFSIYDGTTERFRLGLTNGNATVTGALAIGNTVQTAASVASTHKVTISIGGVTYYLLATNV